MTAPILQVQNLTRRFGGLVAVNDVSFDLYPGEIVGLIGPNGAGKTTLFNILTGIYPPSAGQILLKGAPSGGLKPHKIAARGMTKTFQNVALFMESSVLDNVVTGGLLKNTLPEARKKARAIFDKAKDRHGQENCHRQKDGHSKVRRGREGSWQQAKEVGTDNEHEQCHDIGEILDPFFAADVFDHLIDKTIRQFSN